MRIEKLSDNQIRIILSQDDLAQRQLKLSELAYGTDKARRLFHDMMQQAAYQYGFDASNMPVMIEAIPMAEGSIVLLVTKVDNPEELDTRFSNFSPAIQETLAASEDAGLNPFEQVINSLRKGLTPSDVEAVQTAASSDADNTSKKQNPPMDRLREYVLLNRLFVFRSMSDAVHAAEAAGPEFTGESTLYADKKNGSYYLSLRMKNIEEVSAMQHTLAILSEYGTSEPATFAREEHLKEHCSTVFAEDALAGLQLI